MSDITGESLPLSTPELIRFAKRNSDLVLRTKDLARGRRGSVRKAASDAGVHYAWVQRFLAGDSQLVDITKVCALYLALIGETPER